MTKESDHELSMTSLLSGIDSLPISNQGIGFFPRAILIVPITFALVVILIVPNVRLFFADGRRGLRKLIIQSIEELFALN